MTSLLFFLNSIVYIAQSIEFGHDFLQYFELNPNYMNLNFGSYGLPPVQVLQNQTKWRQQMESCADCWFRYNVTPYINQVQKQMANYLGIADWTDLVFTLNASHGANAILRSIGDELFRNCKTTKTKKCKILYFNTAYKMVENTLEYLLNVLGDPIDTIQFNVTTEMFSNSSLLLQELDTFLDDIDALNTVYLASVSHITSVPSMIFEVASIQKLLRNKYNVLLLIDGAHAMGQIDVNITEIDADIYLSNAHKWLFSPKGSSILYVRKELQGIVYPTVISLEGHGTTQFQKYFNYQGTNDHSAWLSMSKSLEFRQNECGSDANIKEYIHGLCVRASDLLVNEMWKTSNLITDDKYYAAMTNIEIPTNDSTKCQMIQQQMYENADDNEWFTWVPTFFYENKCCVRLSCQIFNELSDYRWFGQRVLDLLSTM